jgi:hypothetical protein
LLFGKWTLVLATVICWVGPVLFSIAETLRIPLELTSKVTSIEGTPQGAGGTPDSSNLENESESVSEPKKKGFAKHVHKRFAV